MTKKEVIYAIISFLTSTLVMFWFYASLWKSEIPDNIKYFFTGCYILTHIIFIFLIDVLCHILFDKSKQNAKL